MIPKGLFTQIGMVIVAVAIIITYVKPAFTEIGVVQNSIGVYQSEREKVSAVNQQLALLVSSLDSVSSVDRGRLQTYLPDELDDISVQRDLLLMSLEAGVLFKSASYVGSSDKTKSRETVEDESFPVSHDFDLSVEGTYGQIKDLFLLMEQNNYPLEVYKVFVKALEGDFMSAEISLVTYTNKKAVANNN